MKSHHSHHAPLVLAVLLTVAGLSVSPCLGWQHSDSTQVFPNRHPDFYHPPPASQFMSLHNLYNQPLNSPLQAAQQQQQFLTPTSNQPQAESAVNLVQASSPLDAVFAPSGRIAPQPPGVPPPPTSDLQVVVQGDAGAHDQPPAAINVRDTSLAGEQPQKPAEQLARVAAATPSGPAKQEHDVTVPAPSPLGKILDVVVRETASALSSAVKDQQQQVEVAKDAKRATVGAEAKVVHTSSESASDNKQTATTGVERRNSNANQQQQQLKPKKSGDKSSLNSIEQQIINQHARASSYGVLNSRRRYEPPTQAPAVAAAAAGASAPQHLRLLPNKLRGDSKLFSNLLSSLGHNSAGGSSSSDFSSSSSSSSSSGGQQQSALLSSLVNNFKSGISSRSSIVKAAISDNKLARTLSTVGKTIGGNKYVASAGAAAALAALGLTVSKFLSPYVMAGAYSKQGMEPLLTSGSMNQPIYSSYGPLAPDRNYQYNFGATTPGDSMLAAAATSQPYELPAGGGAWDPSQLQAALNSFAQQQQQQQTDTTGNLYAAYRPPGSASAPTLSRFRPQGALQSQKNPFDAGASGHYSNFYSSQSEYEQANGSGLDASAATNAYDSSQQPGHSQQPQQQFGTYISGAPAVGETGGELLSGYPAQEASASGGFQAVDQSASGSSSSMYTATDATVAPQQYEQVLAAAASSDTPIYSTTGGRVHFASGSRGAPQHRRSGAVMLKLDEATRQLIKQQLRAEAQRAPASTLLNYNNYLTLGTASGGSGSSSRARFAAPDQSSASEPLSASSQMTDQRVAADSSGDYATFVQFSPSAQTISSNPQTIKASWPTTAGGAPPGTIESNYARIAQQGQPQFVITSGAGAQSGMTNGLSELRASPAQSELAYNSIRPPPQVPQAPQAQMQTRRNEPAASAYFLIRPNTMTLAPPPPSEQQLQSSPSSSLGVIKKRSQPQLVPIVGSAARSPSQSAAAVATARDHRLETTSSWNFVNEHSAPNQKLPEGESKKQSSLDSPSSSSSAAAVEANSQHRVARTPSARLATGRVESWQIPAVSDQASLIRDYEVLAAAQQQQQQPQSQEEQPALAAKHDERQPADVAPPSTRKADEAKIGNSAEQQPQPQQQDELLQVASNMRANLIQLTAGGGEQGVSQAEYQLEGRQENNPAAEADKRVGDGNKLIEAKTNTNNARDGGGPAASALSSAQHDHNHQQRHRSHTAAAATTAQDNQRGDNVLVELMPANGNENGQLAAPPATTTTGADQTSSSLQEASESKEKQQQRAFRGIVAGGLGGTAV